MKLGQIWYEKHSKSLPENKKSFCRIKKISHGRYSHNLQRKVEYDYQESLIFRGSGEDYLIYYDYWKHDESGGHWESPDGFLGRPAFLALYYRPEGLISDMENL